MPTLREDLAGTLMVAGTQSSNGSSNGLCCLLSQISFTWKLLCCCYCRETTFAPSLLHDSLSRRYESANILLDLRNKRISSSHENTNRQVEKYFLRARAVPGMYKCVPWCESLKQIEDTGEKRDPSIKAT